MLFQNIALALLPVAAMAASPDVYAKSRSRARAVDAQADTHSVEKRAFNGRATFYDVGLGACGWHNVESDYIVALNSAQYGGGYPGPQCGKSITISYGGQQVQATIADECPTCPYGGLDLSRSLFRRFASEGTGVFYMDWWFNDGSSQPTTQAPPPPPPKPTTTWTPEPSPEPTTTWTPPPSTTPTSTWVEPSTTSTQAATSTYVTPSASAAVSTPATSQSVSPSDVSASASASAASASASAASASAALSGSANASSTASASSSSASSPAASGVVESTAYRSGNLAMLNEAVVHLGRIVVVGAEH